MQARLAEMEAEKNALAASTSVSGNGTPVPPNVGGGETNETHEGDGNMEEDGESSEAVDMRSVFIGNVRSLGRSSQGDYRSQGREC